METLPTVEIFVQSHGTCPVLQTGDRMMYVHPAIEGVQTCAQALAVLAPAAEDVARAKAEGRAMPPLSLTCPVEGCGAKFVLKVVSGLTPVCLRERTPVPVRRKPGVSERLARRERARRKPKRSFLWKAFLFLLVVTVLGAGAFVGVGYWAPHLYPPILTAQMKRWNIPLPREWFSSASPAGAPAGAPAATAQEPAAPEKEPAPPAKEPAAPAQPPAPVAPPVAPAKEPDKPAEPPATPAQEPAAPAQPPAPVAPPAAPAKEPDKPAEPPPAPAEPPAAPEKKPEEPAEPPPAPAEPPAAPEKKPEEPAEPPPAPAEPPAAPEKKPEEPAEPPAAPAEKPEAPAGEAPGGGQ